MVDSNDNYSKAYISKAYGMQIKKYDDQGNVVWDTPSNNPVFGEGASNGNSRGGGHYPYLSPSPLFNIFLTLEFKF